MFASNILCFLLRCVLHTYSLIVLLSFTILNFLFPSKISQTRIMDTKMTKIKEVIESQLVKNQFCDRRTVSG